MLPKEWQDSELRAIAIDQTAAAHPAATAIIGSLAQSVGILFYGSRLAVMPDDPALGEFRKTFGGTVGTFDEYITPGYEGITEIVSSFDLWKKWREGGPENRVDSRAFLKARLFDLVVGNWDRHQGQWRWARIPGQPLWEPLPEDADQAFTRYEGKAMGAVRSVVPRFMRYSGEYPKRIEGLTTNNYDVTRWLLADVEWPVFEEVARELAARMTDAAIDEAMHRMPPEWYAIDGAQMTKDLRQRRDGIVAYARKFYLHLADRVDVRGSDRADLADVQHLDDGSLQLTLSPLGAGGAAGTPYYTRRFSPKETQEIRLYLLGGNDRVVASGPRKGGIHVRVLGDAGNDTVDDSQSGGLDVEDGRGDNVVKRGPGTKVSESEWKNPAPEKDRPWLEPRNYGHWTVPMAQVYWEPNQAFMLGGGVTRTSWGFRKYPWANMQAFTLLYSTGYNNVRASYDGQWRLSDTKMLGTVKMRFSGIENRTSTASGTRRPTSRRRTLHMTETNEYSVFPALRWQASSAFELHVGAEAKVIQTKGGDSLVEQEQVYGAGTFGEAVLRAGLEYDSRGRSVGMTELRGMAAPDATAAAMAPPVTGRAGPGRGLLRPEGLGRDRELRRRRGQRLRLPRQPAARARHARRRPRAVGRLPVVRVGEHLGGVPRRPRLLQRPLPRRLVALRQRRAALVDRQAQEGRAAAALGPDDLRRVRPRLVRGRELEEVAHRLRRRADAAADRHADGPLRLDGQRHRGHPLLRRGRLLVLNPGQSSRTGLQLLSGSKRSIAWKASNVFGPRSFSQTTPSWLTRNDFTPVFS